ncbi:hypothetical protein GY45DRAFT_1315181 [Cubamyces sp. BRFM 1775]|nr:hypothetical protein GY45DRAFT_1315181 [Cubamyces sp. BRFM 1775]
MPAMVLRNRTRGRSRDGLLAVLPQRPTPLISASTTRLRVTNATLSPTDSGITSSPTPAGTSSTSTSTASTPVFSFTLVPDVQKCASSKVQWSYSGESDITISLLLVSPSEDGLGIILGSNLKATTGSFTWNANYTSGTYLLEATGPNIDTRSLPFSIGDAGSDPSCLPPGSASASLKSTSSSRAIKSFSPLLPGTTLSSTTSDQPALQTTVPPITPIDPKSEPVASVVTPTSIHTQSTQNTRNTQRTQSTQSTQSSQSGASTSGGSPTAGAEQSHTIPIAGIVVGGVAAVIVIVLACICLSTALRRRARNASSSSWRRSANWIGLPYDDDSSSTSGSSPTDEKSLEGSPTKPPAVLVRLEPNRRKPSALSIEPTPVTTTTTTSPQQVIQPEPLTPTPTKAAMDTGRADSPEMRRNSYRTRKPVPQLFPTGDEADAVLLVGELESPKEDRRSPTSAVPSSATSRMYRGRDSGYSVRSRSPIDKENARASSVIDPQLFGTGTKPMYSVVPAVPPLPSL